jgi:predicted nuclease with TOPRIM domain
LYAPSVRDNDLDEMLGLVEVIVGAAVMCENRGVFISKITGMDHISQAVLKALIQRVMERVVDLGGTASDPVGDATGNAEVGGSMEDSEDYIRSQELVRHLQEERQRLLRLVDDLEHRNADLIHDKNRAEDRLSSLQNEHNALISSGGGMSAGSGASSAAVIALNESLKAEIEDMRRDLDVQVVENENIRGSLKAFTQKYEALKEMHAKMEMENQQLADELDITRDKAAKLARAEATIDKYQKRIEEMMPLKKLNAEYLDKMDKYVDQIYELESTNKSINRMIEQYRDKNVELEREKYEALSAQQMQAFEVTRLNSELEASLEARRFLEEELTSVKDELQSLSEANAAMESVKSSSAAGGDVFETESVASLREKVKRLELEVKRVGPAGVGGESSHGEGSSSAGNAEIASLTTDLAMAHKLRKEREDEIVVIKKQVAELSSELKKSSKLSCLLISNCAKTCDWVVQTAFCKIKNMHLRTRRSRGKWNRS